MDDSIEIRDARASHRFFVDNAVITSYGKVLGPYGIAVYVALCMHAGKSTQTCWPSHKTLAEEIGIGPGKVRKCLQELKHLGLIAISARRGKNGGQTSNIYTLLSLPPTEPKAADMGKCSDTNGDAPDDTPPPYMPDTPPPYREMTTNNPKMEQECSDANASESKTHSELISISRKRTPGHGVKVDPRTKTPAIQCAYAVAGNRYPPREIYDDVIRVLGECPDGKRLYACRKAWLAHGHNPNSWQWLFDWYVNGIPAYARQVAGLACEPEVIQIVDTMRGGL